MEYNFQIHLMVLEYFFLSHHVHFLCSVGMIIPLPSNKVLCLKYPSRIVWDRSIYIYIIAVFNKNRLYSFNVRIKIDQLMS